ncbi:MAG: NUDIX domain-containing protein [Alkalispirochaetaceae bacterium]
MAARGGRLFLARRQAGGELSRRWEFPGGKCRDEESLQGCLEREFLEELEMRIRAGEEIGSVPFEHRGVAYQLVALTVTMEGEPQLLHVHEEVGWFTEEEVVALDLADSDRQLFDRFRSRFRELLRRSSE